MYSFRKFAPVLLLALVVLCSGFVAVDNWLTIKVDAQGYQIDFPQQPSAEPEKLETDLGELTLNILLFEPGEKFPNDENALYLVNTTDYPEGTVSSANKELLPEFFRAYIDGAAGNVEGKLLSEKEISIDGYPGREVKFSFSDEAAFIRMRMYLVENRMLVLQTITLAEKDNNPSINRFFNSFKLLKKK